MHPIRLIRAVVFAIRVRPRKENPMKPLAAAKAHALNVADAFGELLGDLKQLQVPTVASAVAMVVAGVAGGLLGLPVTAATVGPYLALIGVVAGVVQRLVAKSAPAPVVPPAPAPVVPPAPPAPPAK